MLNGLGIHLRCRVPISFLRIKAFNVTFVLIIMTKPITWSHRLDYKGWEGGDKKLFRCFFRCTFLRVSRTNLLPCEKQTIDVLQSRNIVADLKKEKEWKQKKKWLGETVGSKYERIRRVSIILWMYIVLAVCVSRRKDTSDALECWECSVKLDRQQYWANMRRRRERLLTPSAKDRKLDASISLNTPLLITQQTQHTKAMVSR